MTEDARLSHWLASQRAATGHGSPDAHVDVDTLARHATGQLSAAKARAVSEHLLACSDGRCLAFVRAQAADVDAAADLLYPPPEEGVARPRTFQCKDVLWSMFEAAAENRPGAAGWRGATTGWRRGSWGAAPEHGVVGSGIVIAELLGGLADDLVPERLDGFFDRLIGVAAKRSRRNGKRWLARQLRAWPTPLHADDKTVGLIFRADR